MSAALATARRRSTSRARGTSRKRSKEPTMARTKQLVGLLAIVSALAATSAGVTARAGDARVADAAMRSDAAGVRALLKQAVDVNAPQGDGMTALHWAAMHGDADLAQMLIYAGANLKAST